MSVERERERERSRTRYSLTVLVGTGRICRWANGLMKELNGLQEWLGPVSGKMRPEGTEENILGQGGNTQPDLCGNWEEPVGKTIRPSDPIPHRGERELDFSAC